MSLRRTGSRNDSTSGTDRAGGLALSTAPLTLQEEAGLFVSPAAEAQLVRIAVAGLEMLEARGKLTDSGRQGGER